MLSAIKSTFSMARKGSYIKAAIEGTTTAVRKAPNLFSKASRSLLHSKKAQTMGKGLTSTLRNPTTLTMAGVMLGGLYGTAKGAYHSGKMLQPHKIEGRRMTRPIAGPGYNIWAGPSSGRQFNLGATGDLPLALHKGRHR